MKNLFLYLNPNGFDAEHARYAEIQIENSLRYWDKDDIIFATNFPYEYQGVKAMQVPGDLFCSYDHKASKVYVIIYLLENGLNDLTWFHDMEAWQIAPLDLHLDKDLGLTDYGWKSNWNTGSFFFKPGALDIFRSLRASTQSYQANEEPVLKKMTDQNFNSINDHIERLNITYNLGKRQREENLKRADKPVRVAHFHPYRENLLEKFRSIIPDYLYRMMNAK